MNEVQRYCGFCWARYGPGQAEHSTNQCTRTEGLTVEASEGLREGVRYDRRCRDCWKCGVSQQICKGIEREQTCQWTGVAAVLWLSWFDLSDTQGVLAEGGYQGGNIAAYRKWLGLRARQKVQGAVVSNGMWLLWRVLLQDERVGDQGEGRAVVGMAVVEEEREEENEAARDGCDHLPVAAVSDRRIDAN